MPCLGDGHSSSQRLPRGVRRTGIQVEGGSRNRPGGRAGVFQQGDPSPAGLGSVCSPEVREANRVAAAFWPEISQRSDH